MDNAKHTVLKFTPEQLQHLRQAIAEEREAMEDNQALGRKLRQEREQRRKQTTEALRVVLDGLAQLRQEQNLSLDQLEELTGITCGNLSRLWNSPAPQVTIDTLERIAAALNHSVRIELVSNQLEL